MATDSTHSELDPTWPPSEPPKGKFAELLGYWIQWKNDQFFGFLRFWKPILGLPKGGPVIVTRFKDVHEILHHPEIFRVTYAPMMDVSVGKFMLGHDGTVYNQRDKGIMRALIQADDLPNIRALVGKIATKCIDEGKSNGTLEVVSNLSRKAPILLNGEYFGFPGPDLETMMRWGRDTQYDMFHNQTMSGMIHDNNIRATQEMREYIKNDLLPKKRRELEKDPDRDDIVSRLLKMKCPHAIGWDEHQMITNIMGLLVGHVETSSAAIVQILDQLLSRPDQLYHARQAALHNDDPKLFRICWEALRFNPVNPIVVRKCAKDYRLAAGTFRNKVIKAGTVVVVGTRSAMKDPRELPSPKKFKSDRPEYHYLHLGLGLHRCLGDDVSKVQVPEAIQMLLLKKNLRRAPGQAGQIDYNGGPFPESFSVAFDD